MAHTAVPTFGGRSLLWALVKQVSSPTEPKNIGWGDSAVTSAANSDVNLFKPQTESRVAGTSTMITTSYMADTYQVTGTITCLVATKTISEAGLFDTITLSGTTAIGTSSQAIGATTITLSAVIGAPTALNYYVQVENEVELFTANQNGTTPTVTRGQLGSASAAHALAVPVTEGGDGGAHTNGTSASAGSAQTASYAQMVPAGGTCAYHADFAGIGLAVNDSIAFTWTVQLT